MARRQVPPKTLPEAIGILRDGRTVRLRPLVPEDRETWLAFFNGLSVQSRYLRFGFAKAAMSQQETDHFTHVSPPDRCAYVATLGSGKAERIVAIGRWDASENDPKAAEVAFTVEDHIQLRGIATAVLEHLAALALEFGYERFTATVLTENMAMQEVFDESGFALRKLLHGGVYSYTIDLTSREEVVRKQVYREHVARAAGVRHLLNPRSVAVIGASREANKIGGAVFRNLLQNDFTGPVFPVNPSASSVAGVLAYPTITDVPADVDLAVIVVPAPHVADIVDQCAAKGVWGVVVITAGFSETGPTGAQLERDVRDRLVSHGMRMIGPNCLGVLNLHPDVSMNATFALSVPRSGPISMGSHSGALGIALLDHARSIGLGVTNFVSMGNGADITANDLLEYWEDDTNTDVVLLYLESFGDPRQFSRVARRVSRSKPVVVLKGGRSAAGAKAASSHTGALAASEAAVDALFRQAGITRVETIEEMFGAAQLLAYQPLPRGNRVAIVTNAGGPGILAADACDGRGLVIQPLSDATQQRLRTFLPGEASVRNPVDVIASATPEQYGQALDAVLEDPDVDSVLLIHIPPLVTQPEQVAAAIRESAANHPDDKPVVACFMMSEGLPSELTVRPGQTIPSFVFPEDAVRALAHATSYTRYLEQPTGNLVRYPDADAEQARTIIESAIAANGEAHWLPFESALDLLRCYGIPVIDTRVATSPDDAAEMAEAVGFPVVIKLRSSTITHKSDVGGVVLSLRSKDAVAEAYRRMEERVTQIGGPGAMEGVVVQPMLSGGQEVILGMTQDPVFGPLMMVGFGGVQVELLKDVSFSLHPLLDVDPPRMLRALKSYPLLTGWRGSKPGDVAKLEEVLLRFSALVDDLPAIEELEINPLVVMNEGEGCTVIDVRARIRGQASAEQP